VINSNLGPILHRLATIHPWRTDRRTDGRTTTIKMDVNCQLEGLYLVYTIKLARRAGYMLAGRVSSMFARSCKRDIRYARDQSAGRRTYLSLPYLRNPPKQSPSAEASRQGLHGPSAQPRQTSR